MRSLANYELPNLIRNTTSADKCPHFFNASPANSSDIAMFSQSLRLLHPRQNRRLAERLPSPDSTHSPSHQPTSSDPSQMVLSTNPCCTLLVTPAQPAHWCPLDKSCRQPVRTGSSAWLRLRAVGRAPAGSRRGSGRLLWQPVTTKTVWSNALLPASE